MLLLSPTASSVLAVATTIHLSLALLRNHRQQAAGVFSPVAVISFSFAALRRNYVRGRISGSPFSPT